MRIALIQTPVEDFYSTPQRTYPLGLTYLAAAIKDLSVEIDILDFITNYGRQTIPVPESFTSIMRYLPYDRSSVSAFHTYYHFGASWKHIERHFKNEHYDICAISSNFYTYSDEVLTTAKIIKSISPDTIVIVGGQNVGPEHTLFTACEDIDHCMTGEAEETFRSFINDMIGHRQIDQYLPGLWNKKEQKWNNIKNRPSFDLKPAADMIPPEKHVIAGKPAMMLATSRGCPMGCRFCSVARTFGTPLRLKPISTIMEEMQGAFDRGIRAFDIEDDNFTFNRRHCIDLLSEIIKKFEGKITIYAMNGLSAEHLDEEIIDLLVRAGMRLLNLSIATASQEQLKTLHRHTDIGHFKDISNIASNRGLKLMGHFISGLPAQSLDEILNTMKLLSELPLVLGISPFYYIPGMPMDAPQPPKNCKDARLTRFWPADNILNEADHITLFRISRWLNYLKDMMSKRKIGKIHFSDIKDRFPDDQLIKGLIEMKTLYGINEYKVFFEHQISEKVITRFFEIFQDSYIYCG